MNAPLRVGMISWAHVHAEFRARALGELPGVRVVAIADADGARGRAAAQRHGVDRLHDDWRELVAAPDIDAVMIHSETAQHAEQAIAVAEAGKHVFCEKPIATTTAEARRIVEAVERAGVDGTAAFVSRFSQEAERAQRIVEAGTIGTVLHARSLIGLAGIAEIGCPPDMVAWITDAQAAGGGAWIDEGSHAIDLLRWLVGDIERVSAFTTNLAKPQLDVEDVGVASLRFASGALGELTTSWSLQVEIGMRNVLELYGSKGTLILSATDRHPRVEVYAPDGSGLLDGWRSPHITASEAEPHDYGSWPPHVHHYKREVASWATRAQAGARPFGPTLRDGLACLEVLEAGYASAARDGAAMTVGEPVAAA
jgi:predicted dehydrogenase